MKTFCEFISEWNSIFGLAAKRDMHQRKGEELSKELDKRYDDKKQHRWRRHMDARDAAKRMLKMRRGDYEEKFGKRPR